VAVVEVVVVVMVVVVMVVVMVVVVGDVVVLLDVAEQEVEVEAERRDEVDDVDWSEYERALVRTHHEPNVTYPTLLVTRHTSLLLYV